MDYNKLMKELENCLGLETSAMESVNQPKPQKEAFEAYDEVEQELAVDLGLGNEPATEAKKEEEPKAEDLVFEETEEMGEAKGDEDDGKGSEDDPKEIFKEAIKAFYNSLDMEPEEAIKVVNEVMAEALDCGECKVDEDDGDNEELDIQSLDEIATSDESVSKEPVAEEGCSNKEEPAKEEPEEAKEETEEGQAFEEFSAKMLNRYKVLSQKEGKINKKNSATEGADEISVCESALNQTSCEFNYSGENLRKIVTEAIRNGVI